MKERRVYDLMRRYFQESTTDQEKHSLLEECREIVTKPQRKTGTRMTMDWVLSDDAGDWAVSVGVTPEKIYEMWPQFRDYHIAKGSIMQDWDAAWRTWIRNHLKKGW